MGPQSKRITRVRIDEHTIWLTLSDGRELAEPIQRQQWVLTDDEHGLNWPALWPPAPEGMVSVWAMEQDQLYRQTMDALQSVGWDTRQISPTQYELVALWRMEADVNNGGFLQFLGNWGFENYQMALQALQAIGATATRTGLQNMYAIVQRLEDAPGDIALSDLPMLLTEDEHEQLQKLEEAFWDYPERLDKLVVHHYGLRDEF